MAPPKASTLPSWVLFHGHPVLPVTVRLPGCLAFNPGKWEEVTQTQAMWHFRNQSCILLPEKLFYAEITPNSV